MQTSSKSLSKTKEAALFNQLAILLADFSHPREVRSFLNEFLTETERSVFAKRLAIIWELHQGKSYEEIKDELKVSSATISSVSENKDSQGIKLAFEKMKLDKKIEKLLNFLT